jgi:hypothetical protein
MCEVSLYDGLVLHGPLQDTICDLLIPQHGHLWSGLERVVHMGMVGLNGHHHQHLVD